MTEGIGVGDPGPSPRPADWPDEPLGVTICRLSIDPVRGRVRHPLQVGIAIRTAMFLELALSGRLVGQNWPEAVGPSDTGNKLPDSVHRAVAGRRSIGWRRWFSHVTADRVAATDYLLDAEVWRREGNRLVDPRAGETVLRQREIARAMSAGELPGDLYTLLVYLLVSGAGGCGRPAPRRAWRLAKVALPPLLPGQGGAAGYAAVRTGLRAIRRAATFRMFSR